eukprot:312574-Prorocentrum_minimum.AAC.1
MDATHDLAQSGGGQGVNAALTCVAGQLTGVDFPEPISVHQLEDWYARAPAGRRNGDPIRRSFRGGGTVLRMGDDTGGMKKDED